MPGAQEELDDLVETGWNRLASAHRWNQDLCFEGLTGTGENLPKTVGNRADLLECSETKH